MWCLLNMNLLPKIKGQVEAEGDFFQKGNGGSTNKKQICGFSFPIRPILTLNHYRS